MKKELFTICVIIASCFIGKAQTGIKFQTEKKWDAIKAEAKAADKLIFLDAYTTWCGPCKKMSNDVFTKNEVGSLFNSKFINVKIDMEKGEGLNLAEEYMVLAYPTLLFIDGDGKMVHKVVGYKSPEELINVANNSQDSDKQFSALLQSYQNGELPNSKILNLITALEDAGEYDQSAFVATKFLYENKNWMDQPQLFLLLNYTKDISSDQFQFILKNEADISKIYPTISNDLDSFVTLFVKAEFGNEYGYNKEKVLNYFKTHRGSRADKLCLIFAFDHAVDFEDPNAAEISGLELDKYAMQLSSEKLNSMAWYFFEHITKKASLKKALEWALLSVKIESKYFNNDTVANLYAKLNDKVNAKQYAKIAIKLGEDQGVDTETTQELLNRL